MARVRLREVAVARVDGQLRGRQSKDEPAVARVHRAKSEDVAEKRPIGVGIGGVKQKVRASDHRRPVYGATCPKIVGPTSVGGGLQPARI